MGYRLPTFNLTANYWRNPGGTLPPTGARLSVECQLREYRTAQQFTASFGNAVASMLVVPAHTDIRGDSAVAPGDTAEVPAGTGRYYHVLVVEDVAKGFMNEYRTATLAQLVDLAGGWPYPTP